MAEPNRKIAKAAYFYKTVNRNGNLRSYDKDGNETGQYTLKSFAYKTIVDQILKDRPTGEAAKEIGASLAGSPKIEKESILRNARQHGATIQEENGFTKISYSMEKLAGSLNEDTQSYAGKIAEQYYDFKNNRLLMANIYDVDSGRLISRSVLTYTPEERGNQVVKIMTEHHEVDPETGEETTQYTQEFFSDMKVSTNQ